MLVWSLLSSLFGQVASLLTTILETPVPMYFALLGFMLYVLFAQQYIGKQPKKDVLSNAEIDEMIAEFEPDPLGAYLPRPCPSRLAPGAWPHLRTP